MWFKYRAGPSTHCPPSPLQLNPQHHLTSNHSSFIPLFSHCLSGPENGNFVLFTAQPQAQGLTHGTYSIFTERMNE